MAYSPPRHTEALINHGRWIAECPRPFCGNAEMATDKQGNPKTQFHCSCCGLSNELYFPPNAVQIWDILLRRPVPHTRNWYPRGHPTALRFNLPDGQTPAELIMEQEAMEDLAEQNPENWGYSWGEEELTE